MAVLDSVEGVMFWDPKASLYYKVRFGGMSNEYSNATIFEFDEGVFGISRRKVEAGVNLNACFCGL